MTSMQNCLPVAVLAVGVLALGAAMPAHAQNRQKIANDMTQCRSDKGPAVLVSVDGIKASTGRVRVQSYPATPAEWLKKGRWLTRIDIPAKAGTMSFCVPVPSAGSYGIAVRHDLDGDGATDLLGDGGAMSNNPSINIFNLGKPSITKTAITVGEGVKSIRVQMRYR